jgi:hypothetical protein
LPLNSACSGIPLSPILGTLDYHLAQIRQHSGWRFPTAQDKEELENWLRHQGAKEAHTADAPV